MTQTQRRMAPSIGSGPSGARSAVGASIGAAVMTLALSNTLGRSVETVQPLEPAYRRGTEPTGAWWLLA